MTKFQEYLQEFADQKSDGLEVRSYSGRGMMGQYCLGITGNINTCKRAIAYAISALHQDLIMELEDQYENEDDGARDAFEPSVDFEDYTQKALDYRQDSMGFDVVFYWPDMEYTDIEGDEDEESD